jgi:hypothetical protein
MMNQQAEAKNGPLAAAMLAAGIGSLVLGLMTVLCENVTAFGNFFNFINSVGNLTGKTWMAILAWLISWAILANKWRDQEVDFGKIYRVTLILVGLGLLGTFPPIFDLF